MNKDVEYRASILLVGISINVAMWKGNLAFLFKKKSYFDSAVLLLEIEFIEIITHSLLGHMTEK